LANQVSAICSAPHLFMQNKPNFSEDEINASSLFTKDYKKIRPSGRAKTNPIQSQFKPNTNPIKANFGQKIRVANPKQSQFQVNKIYNSFLAFTFISPGYNLKMQTWTIQKLLNWIVEYFTDKGIESPRLSAELLLSRVVGLKRIELYTKFDRTVPSEQLDHLRDLVKRASQNEPVAYLVGRTEFYSLQIKVTPDCMIPRPETELLVERAIEFLRDRNTDTQFVCDLCTGFGCIAVAIAKNFSDARIIATDICDAA